MTSETKLQSGARPHPLERAAWTFARLLTIALFAGFLAGGLAGGIGSRIAMRISAIAAPEAEQGGLTDAEQVVGEITLGGTLELVIFGGLLTGLIVGLVYLANHQWLTAAGPWRGVLFGAFLLATFGWMIIDGDNPDFHRFGPPALNIGLFAAVFLLFGVLIVPLFDWVDRLLPRLSFGGLASSPALPFESTVAAAVSLTVYSIAGTLAVPIALGLPFLGQDGTNGVAEVVAAAALPLYVVIVPPVAALLASRSGDGMEARDGTGPSPWVLWVAVALPVAVGLALGVDAVLDIYEADR
ncbi:MAG: hypothetical protein WEE64_07840 [Dehalococcoidia bacterium]